MKKIIIILSTLAFMLGISMYLFFDGSDDAGNYSGEQRRIWNELIQVNYNRKRHAVINPADRLQFKDFDATEERLNVLRGKQGLRWNVVPGAKTSGLPLEVLSHF